MKNVRIYEYAFNCKLEMPPYTRSIPIQPLTLTTLVTLCYYQWHTMLLYKKSIKSDDPTCVNLKLAQNMKRRHQEIVHALEC